MGFLDSLKTWFRSESADAKDLLGETRGRLNTDLSRREAELAASPAERMEQLQSQIADGGDGFDAVRDKIEGRSAKADAVEDLAEAAEGSAEDVSEAADGAIEDLTETADGFFERVEDVADGSQDPPS